MKNKTKVKITGVYNHGTFKIGQVGYIDGYVRGGNDVPYAVVISEKVLDLVPTHGCFEVISESEYLGLNQEEL